MNRYSASLAMIQRRNFSTSIVTIWERFGNAPLTILELTIGDDSDANLIYKTIQQARSRAVYLSG